MLRKLIKHELNATGRILLPLYSIMIILTLVNSVLNNINVFTGTLNIIQAFMLVAYGISILATLAVTFIVMILRFYKNLMSDEGYLMFTLPAKPSQLINAKLIVSLLWNIISIIVVGASLLAIIIASQHLGNLRDLTGYLVASLKDTFGDKYIILVFELIFMIFLSLVQQILLIYLSIAAGHMFGNHKVIGSFAAYVAITTATQIIITLMLVAWAFLAGSTLDELEAIPHLLFPFTIAISLVVTALFYIGTNYIFNKKLNLE